MEKRETIAALEAFIYKRREEGYGGFLSRSLDKIPTLPMPYCIGRKIFFLPEKYYGAKVVCSGLIF